jgi:hypothetical protein
VADHLVARRSGAVALLFGVRKLRRGHASVAAGVFVELGSGMLEAATLFVAASMALRRSS